MPHWMFLGPPFELKDLKKSWKKKLSINVDPEDKDMYRQILSLKVFYLLTFARDLGFKQQSLYPVSAFACVFALYHSFYGGWISWAFPAGLLVHIALWIVLFYKRHLLKAELIFFAFNLYSLNIAFGTFKYLELVGNLFMIIGFLIRSARSLVRMCQEINNWYDESLIRIRSRREYRTSQARRRCADQYFDVLKNVFLYIIGIFYPRYLFFGATFIESYNFFVKRKSGLHIVAYYACFLTNCIVSLYQDITNTLIYLDAHFKDTE